MANPNSSAIVAGAQGLASQYNNLRLDAIGVVNIISANTFSALQLIKNEAGGFIRFDNQWKPSNCELMIAAATGPGGYVTTTAYKAGSIIPGYGGALTPDAIYYGDNSGNLSTTPGAARIPVGVALDSSTLYFNPKVSSFKVVAGVSAAALSILACVYLRASDQKWALTDTTARESGHAKIVGFVANAVSGADEAINVILPGQIVSGFSGSLTAGSVYYTGNSGAISTTRGAFSRPLGVAISTSELYFFPLEPNENFVIESVTAGENWSVRDLLYFKKSDQRFYKADADSAESGILEVPAIAFATHSGGAGSTQLVYMQGSYIRGAGFTFTAGDRLFPSGTAGAYVANTPASYDTFYRSVANAIDTDVVAFFPKQMEFLPTGMQEKGFIGATCKAVNSLSGNPGNSTGVGISFKKIMSSTPSSITFSSTNTAGVTSGPTASYITRFGFSMEIDRYSGDGLYYWYGTYQTVGN